jgi:50S ribosomal subunit-associated GTPase HflX
MVKADAVSDQSILTKAKQEFNNLGIECHIISSVSGLGIQALVDRLSEIVQQANIAIQNELKESIKKDDESY